MNMKKERFKLVTAVHLFLVKNNKILLLRRFNTGYEDGNYSVIAGHLDGKEPTKKAMAREALEEAGVKVKTEDLKVVHVMHRNAKDHERIDFFLTTEKWQGRPRIIEPDKCDGLSWFHFKKLPKNIVPYVRSAIGRYLKGVLFSQFGWEEA